MIDPALLATFAVVTGLTSLTPGPSMLFIMSQAVWRGARSGFAALAGMQLGFCVWWVLAGVGLGTIAHEAPRLFLALTAAGALYLAWLGVQAWRHAGVHPGEAAARSRRTSPNALRDGVFIAIGNPKSLVYVAALVPPFVDADRPVAPQLLVLALLAMAIDVAIGCAYILAGSRLAAAMERGHVRLWLDRGVGAIFLAIALGVLIEATRHAGG
jgi:homoserine/homoserine lactone efflux protein